MKSKWVGFAIVAAVAFVGCRRSSTPTVDSDPAGSNNRRQIASGTQQQQGEDSYVADSRCAECHAGIAAQFARHPMARSLTTISSRQKIERFEKAHRAQFSVPPFHYLAAQRSDGRLIHSRRLLPLADPAEVRESHQAKFGVGSGQQARSYLIERDNRLFLSPLTWYVVKQIWDLSPGYETNNLGFDRVVLEDCLYCHSNGADLVVDTKNHYRNPIFPRGPAIGCQRCHGPGKQHVRRHAEDLDSVAGDDATIVNPGKLTPALREAVCQQCHLSGVARVTRAGRDRYDYRPGQPLDSAITTFVGSSANVNSAAHFVGQVEQMYASRCFQASNGALGCISCHDPHMVPSPAEKQDFYRSRCLRCHVEQGCAEDVLVRSKRVGGADHCIACHMPDLDTDIRHTATTDHRIPRWRDMPRSSPAAKESFPIAAFPPRVSAEDDLDAQRDVALGMLQSQPYHPRQIVDSQRAKLVLPLTQAVNRNPVDIEGRESLADLLLQLQRPGAIRRYRDVLAQRPHREHAVVQLAVALGKQGQWDEAIELWQRANQLNNQMSLYRYHWGQALAARGRWSAAHALAREGVKAFPTSPHLWQLLAESALRQDQSHEAEQAFSILCRLQPESSDALQNWFDSIGH